MWNLKQYWGDFTCPGVKTPLSMTLFIPRLDMAWRCPLHIQRTLQVYRDPWTWSSQCYRHCNKSFTGIECWGQIMCKSFPSTPKLLILCHWSVQNEACFQFYGTKMPWTCGKAVAYNRSTYARHEITMPRTWRSSLLGDHHIDNKPNRPLSQVQAPELQGDILQICSGFELNTSCNLKVSGDESECF